MRQRARLARPPVVHEPEPEVEDAASHVGRGSWCIAFWYKLLDLFCENVGYLKFL